MHDVVERGRAKLARKNAHWLVANKIGGPNSAFGADVSSIAMIHHTPDVEVIQYGPATKPEIAHRIWTEVARDLKTRSKQG